MVNLSIIIPCYNVASYLYRCFDSIFSQSVNFEYEVIAVNDASTDNTLEVLYDIKRKHSNLVILNKQCNEKLTAARTSGIMISKGEYIMHLDPDDCLLPGGLNTVFINRNCDWDILFYNIKYESSDGRSDNLIYPINIKRQFDMSNSSDRRELFSVIKGSCFAKIIKRKILDNLNYYHFNYNIGEDFAFNFEVYNKANIVVYDPRVFYYYRYNTSSLVRSAFDISRLDYSKSWVCNVMNVINAAIVYPESLYYMKLNVERYSIGLLLLIWKQPEPFRSTLIDKWKVFFYSQLSLYGNLKRKWYVYLLNLNNKYLLFVLFALSLCQKEPYIERIRRLYKLLS